jgi:hypothetical protein
LGASCAEPRLHGLEQSRRRGGFSLNALHLSTPCPATQRDEHHMPGLRRPCGHVHGEVATVRRASRLNQSPRPLRSQLAKPMLSSAMPRSLTQERGDAGPE